MSASLMPEMAGVHMRLDSCMHKRRRINPAAAPAAAISSIPPALQRIVRKGV